MYFFSYISTMSLFSYFYNVSFQTLVMVICRLGLNGSPPIFSEQVWTHFSNILSNDDMWTLEIYFPIVLLGLAGQPCSLCLPPAPPSHILLPASLRHLPPPLPLHPQVSLGQILWLRRKLLFSPVTTGSWGACPWSAPSWTSGTSAPAPPSFPLSSSSTAVPSPTGLGKDGWWLMQNISQPCPCLLPSDDSPSVPPCIKHLFPRWIRGCWKNDLHLQHRLVSKCFFLEILEPVSGACWWHWVFSGFTPISRIGESSMLSSSKCQRSSQCLSSISCSSPSSLLALPRPSSGIKSGRVGRPCSGSGQHYHCAWMKICLQSWRIVLDMWDFWSWISVPTFPRFCQGLQKLFWYQHDALGCRIMTGV